MYLATDYHTTKRRQNDTLVSLDIHLKRHCAFLVFKKIKYTRFRNNWLLSVTGIKEQSNNQHTNQSILSDKTIVPIVSVKLCKPKIFK